MQPKSDAQLLRDYAESGSDSAFSELVARHTDLVYSAALRQVPSPDLACDVAQTVFTSLARDAQTLAGKLNPDASLAGWLCRCTRNVALNLRRDDFRRHSRERQVMETLHPAVETAPDWDALRPILDEAISRLNEADHDALVLRFFKKQDLRSVGLALGVSDDTAQKRVSRALEKLREQLARHGITTPGAALPLAISANAVQAAPAGLAATLSTAAVLAGNTFVATTTAAKAIVMTTLQKTIIAATVAVLAGTGIYEARQASHLRAEIETIQQQTVPMIASSNNAALAALQEKMELLTTQNVELASALTHANADKARLEMEREQAKRAAALYKDLGDLANSKDTNPTNAYPTERHVWVGWGRFGRLAALSKEDNGKLSPEEKSALEEAQMKLLEELPHLVKAAKQFDAAKDAAKSSKTERPTAEVTAEVMDMITCILYGALNLDEQQFNQVYGSMQKLGVEAKLQGISKENPEAAEAVKEFMEQWKAETLTLLTPEQARIFAEVVTHFRVEPGSFGFNFNF